MKHNHRFQFPFWTDITATGSDLEQLELAVQSSTLKIVRLVPRFASILETLPSLGPCILSNLSDSATFSTATSLRAFYRRGANARLFAAEGTIETQLHYWKYGYAIFPQPASQPRSIHQQETPQPGLFFFDVYGKLIFDVRLAENASLPAFDMLVSRYASLKQEFDSEILVKSASASESARLIVPLIPDMTDNSVPARAVSLSGYRPGLNPSLGYPFAFMQTIRQRLAMTIRRDVLSRLLNEWRKNGLTISISAGCAAITQTIHSKIVRFRHDHHFLDIHASRFSIRIRYPDIARALLVRHPEQGRHSASLRLYNKEGATLASLMCDDTFRSSKTGTAFWRETFMDYLPGRLR